MCKERGVVRPLDPALEVCSLDCMEVQFLTHCLTTRKVNGPARTVRNTFLALTGGRRHIFSAMPTSAQNPIPPNTSSTSSRLIINLLLWHHLQGLYLGLHRGLLDDINLDPEHEQLLPGDRLAGGLHDVHTLTTSDDAVLPITVWD